MKERQGIARASTVVCLAMWLFEPPAPGQEKAIPEIQAPEGFWFTLAGGFCFSHEVSFWELQPAEEGRGYVLTLVKLVKDVNTLPDMKPNPPSLVVVRQPLDPKAARALMSRVAAFTAGSIREHTAYIDSGSWSFALAGRDPRNPAAEVTLEAVGDPYSEAPTEVEIKLRSLLDELGRRETAKGALPVDRSAVCARLGLALQGLRGGALKADIVALRKALRCEAKKPDGLQKPSLP